MRVASNKTAQAGYQNLLFVRMSKSPHRRTSRMNFSLPMSQGRFYPELTHELVTKNQDLRKVESDTRYHQFTGQTSKIIADLEKEGVVPSYNKVRCRMVEYHGFRYKDFTRLWGQAGIK